MPPPSQIQNYLNQFSSSTPNSQIRRTEISDLKLFDSVSSLISGPRSSSQFHRLKMSAPPTDSPVDGEVVRSVSTREIMAVIDSSVKQVANDRLDYVKKRMKENSEKVRDAANNHYKEAMDRRKLPGIGVAEKLDMLAKRQNDAIVSHNSGVQDDESGSSAVLLGSSIAVKNAVCPITLPKIDKIPPYTTWAFLERNQRMTEDQSVVGRRRIYYDQNGGEALIASDSDDEAIDYDDPKKVFTESEDYVLRRTIEEVGLSDTTLDLLARSLSRKPCEIQARYECLTKNENPTCQEIIEYSEGFVNPYIDKDIDAALDSVDNLFCRRCLVYDCRLHGCSQDLIYPAEKAAPWTGSDEKDPCGPNCYRLVLDQDINANSSSEQEIIEGKCISDDVTSSSVAGKGGDSRSSKRIAQNNLVANKKRRKRVITSDSDSDSDSDSELDLQNNTNQEIEDSSSSQKLKSDKSLLGVASNESKMDQYVTSASETIKNEEVLADNKCWKSLEKALCEKGIEIFGRNSCLIARNLMNGMKNCSEIFTFLSQSVNMVDLDESSLKADGNGGGDQIRSRFLRRKGKVRRLKYSSKASGYPSFRKRSSELKDQPCRQYNPCGCQSGCGKDCTCHVNGTFCEKFCGCPKNCKNRIRGCNCAKSQCRTRLCPCFAAERECDPDVCRNCWIGCGHDALVGPSQSGQNYECMNMKLLLRQQQRILLGKSNVSGWGAFLKNNVAKNEYLGEYTGELISHFEAEKRGKIYDRVNQSFLFNLNDQFVLDAFRKGDKLKFANHSADPNCYAKVVMVNGDHRVGIFAKHKIQAGEELFYDYLYTPDSSPAWAMKPDSAATKKADDNAPSSSRAKKNTT